MSERLFDIEPPDERVRFLALLAPFAGLDPAELERVAESATERLVPAGEAVLVESGLPGTQLYVVHEGALELLPSSKCAKGPWTVNGRPAASMTRTLTGSSSECRPKERISADGASSAMRSRAAPSESSW